MRRGTIFSVLAALTSRQGQGSLAGRRQKLIDLEVFGEQRVKNGLRPFSQLHRVEDDTRLAQIAVSFFELAGPGGFPSLRHVPLDNALDAPARGIVVMSMASAIR